MRYCSLPDDRHRLWPHGKYVRNEAGIMPDIMCIGKALTGGAITMGATLASEEVLQHS